MLVLPDLQEQVELLREQRVVVFEPQPEERKRVDERSAPDDHLRASLRQQIEGREVLEDADRIGGAQDGDGARQPNALRSRRRRRKNDRGRGIEVVLAVVLPDPEDIETYLIRMFDLLDQVPQALRWTDREACFVVRCCETVDANFYSRITRHSNHAPIVF